MVGTGVVRGPPFLHATCLYPPSTQCTGGSLQTLGPTATAEEKRDNLKYGRAVYGRIGCPDPRSHEFPY